MTIYPTNMSLVEENTFIMGKCPGFDRFLSTCFEDRPEQTARLMALIRKTLTGQGSGLALAVFRGHGGRNGKTTCLKILQSAFADNLGGQAPRICLDERFSQWTDQVLVLGPSQPRSDKLSGLVILAINEEPPAELINDPIWHQVEIFEWTRRFVTHPRAANEKKAIPTLQANLVAETPAVNFTY